MRIINNYEKALNEIIQTLGNDIIVATPLGPGKPNAILNKLYEYASSHPEISLTICTALTLQRPKGKHWIEKRFINLFSDRIFGDYPELLYETARLSNTLPANIKVLEFYFPPGKYLGVPSIQKNYISSNYTHVCRDIIDRGANLILPMLAHENDQFSYSCNADVTADMIKALKIQKRPFMAVGQVNKNLPFMYGQAQVDKNDYDFILDIESDYFQVFSPPKLSVTNADFMIGLYASSLVKDDGELQVGIGSLGDAVIYGLVLKHQQNSMYQNILDKLNTHERFQQTIKRVGSLERFKVGLFGATEMMVDGFMELYTKGILKKKVYDDIALQRLINQEMINPTALKYDDISLLQKRGLVADPLTKEDFTYLQYWGFVNEGISYKEKIANSIEEVGTSLKHGHLMHAGFFLGPGKFYAWLKGLPKVERKLFDMRSVLKINQLYGHEAIDRLHRKNARFINSCMMTTLAGAHVSDALEDGRIISGVGGQFNFVSMAQELPDGHSILMMRSTRFEKGKLKSNIVPHYGHITVPKHMRDILITEYGIAFLRGKTDEEIIKELIHISDSRFQQELLDYAKTSGKVSSDYTIPKMHQNNLPDFYSPILTTYIEQGHFAPFPFGTDLTPMEIKIGGALKKIKFYKDRGGIAMIQLVVSSFLKKQVPENKEALELMKLNKTINLSEFVFKKILNYLL